MSRYHLSIDWGDTFTDFVLVDEAGHLFIKKIPSSFREPTAERALEISCFLDQYTIQPADMRTVVMGLNVQMPPGEALACIHALNTELERVGWAIPVQLVTTDGQVVSLQQADREPQQVVQPGRAGAQAAGQFYGSLIGDERLVLLKMGGSVTHLSLAGQADAGRTLSLGGNNFVGIDVDGSLAILTEHADYRTGPACFGRGGTRPTLTDVDLLLGYLNPNYFLNGRLRLDCDAARRVVDEHIATPMGLRVEEVALRLSRGVDKYIAKIIRKLANDPHFDWPSYRLMAFGGAGPVHATEVARQLGIKRLVVPVAAGVATALGYLLLAFAQTPESELIDTVIRPTPTGRASDQDFVALKGYRAVFYEEDLTPCSCPIYDRARIHPEDRLSGPGVVEEPETTILIRDKSYVEMDRHRNLLISMR